MLFPALLLFWVMLLISPYIVINRMAAWADHTPISAEAIDQRDTLKVSQQDDRTVWDPKLFFRDSEGRFLDYKIPAIDWTIWFYLTLFGYYFAFFAAQKNDRGRAESLVMAQAWAVSSWIAYPIFAVLPAHINMRWQLGEMEGIYGFVYKAFHSLDEPFNAWPCLHIAQSFIIAVALSRWWRQRKWNWAVCLLWPAWLGLFISVMTTKQHFIWDSITGALLGVGVWLAIMRPGFRHLDSVADDDLPLAKLG